MRPTARESQSLLWSASVSSRQRLLPRALYGLREEAVPHPSIPHPPWARHWSSALYLPLLCHAITARRTPPCFNPRAQTGSLEPTGSRPQRDSRLPVQTLTQNCGSRLLRFVNACKSLCTNIHFCVSVPCLFIVSLCLYHHVSLVFVIKLQPIRLEDLRTYRVSDPVVTTP